MKYQWLCNQKENIVKYMKSTVMAISLLVGASLYPAAVPVAAAKQESPEEANERLYQALQQFNLEQEQEEYEAAAPGGPTLEKPKQKAEVLANQRMFLKAVTDGDEDTMRRLLAQGIDINAADSKNGWTALMIASQNGNEAIVRLLLAQGVNINVADFADWTALMIAAHHGQAKVVIRLLEASPSAQSIKEALSITRKKPAIQSLLANAKLIKKQRERFTQLLPMIKKEKDEFLALITVDEREQWLAKRGAAIGKE
jgi:hypothetical protein